MRSCMQLKLFREHPELIPKPNSNVIDGETFQHKVSSSMENLIGEEMRGTYIHGDICINFCNDIVCNDRIIEVKSVSEERGVPEWYLKSSTLQCAMYKALIRKSYGKLITASFFSKLGNPVTETIVDKNINYLLYFGKNIYEVEVYNDDSIVDFFIEKAKASLDWTNAKIFDANYKHREYETLKDYFKITKII